MTLRFLAAIVFGAALTATTAYAQDAPPATQNPGTMPRAGYGPPPRGGMGMMLGRSIAGTVTEAAADRFTIQTFRGGTYTILFDANTHIVKQTAGAGRGRGMGAGMGMRAGGGQPVQASEIKASEIKVGDAIAALGEVDSSTLSVGAVGIVLLDPERARLMKHMQANYGKTWLMGKVTAIDGTKITIAGALDNQPYTLQADENTYFRERRQPIALAGIHVGDMVRAEGGMKGSDFAVRLVNVMPLPLNARVPRSAQPQ